MIEHSFYLQIDPSKTEGSRYMVIETVDEREKTSHAVFTALRDRVSSSTYADDIAKVLEADGIGVEKTLWTIWRLIDENRLFLDDSGHLVLEKPERDE